MEDCPLDMISVTDVGECVMSIFSRPRFYSRKVLSLAGDRLTMEEIAHVFGKYIFNKKFISPKVMIALLDRRIVFPWLFLLFFMLCFNSINYIRIETA